MRKYRILIADDDRDLVDIITLHCRAMGLKVDSADNAMTALEKIEEYEPDLVILDVNMPQGNGLSVCEMMANHRRLSNIPVIIVTGNKNRDVMRRCHNLCAYYVTKCQNVWTRIEPLLNKVLELETRDCVEPTDESMLVEKWRTEPQPRLVAEPSFNGLSRDFA